MLAKSVVIALLALRASSAPFPQTDSAQNCQSSYDGTFGITIMNSTTSAQTSQMGDGQPNASGQQVSQIGDGQTQVNQIDDGQIQNQNTVTQIGDGQIQQQASPPVNQIGDGQVQQQASPPVSQIGDGQIQNNNQAVSQINDGQIQNTSPAVSQISDGQTQASGEGTASTGGSGSSTGGSFVGCRQADSLQLTLKDGILTDSKGRTGYIAANYQFQFDAPPQSGTITASGFSVCDGALSLNGKDTWYQCLSGDFYNLYDRRPEGRQDCEEVKMMLLNLVDC